MGMPKEATLQASCEIPQSGVGDAVGATFVGVMHKKGMGSYDERETAPYLLHVVG